MYDISVSDEIFNDNYVLSGNNGTKYDANYRNKDYAVIDRVGKNGYLSVKMNISSDVYDLDNDYIYVGNDEFDISNIVISGAIEKEYINNKLYIEYNDLVIKQYDITSMSSDTYNLDNDYIIVKGSINTSLIDIVNGSIEVDDDNNELIIKYGNIVLDKYDILYPLESISLNKSFMKLKIGTMSSLSVIYNPFNTTDSKDVIWTSSDESILTVDSEGNIEAVGIGSATITVTSVLDSRLTASCEVMVVDYLSGDMNNNGKIEFADVMILLRSYLGITEETDDSVKFGDMNGNGKIDFADVMILLRSYLDID